ncbi:MAG: XdhC family protein [Chloroflexi bacterium]|nr:XdhC family protein [Chloroflexota bacterium]
MREGSKLNEGNLPGNRRNGGDLFARSTVIATRGSTPRKSSAKMLVLEDGTIRGTIGGGCGEAEVWTAAMQSMEDGRPRIVTVDLTTPIDGPDKICGGIMDIYVEPIMPLAELARRREASLAEE